MSHNDQPSENVGSIRHLPLADLHFDLSNPRYGPDAPQVTNDREALDYILSRFDMSDVLSSISVNGFFDSEPLVGVESQNGGVRILEGNRRLAACLVLAGDPRASSQARKRTAFPLKAGITIEKVPVMVYPEAAGSRHLLPYLGVRHIVGGKPWDSYAKAHWVATTLRSSDSALSLGDIKAMLGDTTGLTERLLASYEFIMQLQREGLFDPQDSVKKGKGSASFPFSLIYNTLDVTSVRKWLKLPEDEAARSTDPIPVNRLEDAGILVKLICGSQKEDFPPALRESRQIRALSRAVQDPTLLAKLVKGAPLSDVEKETMPDHSRILEDLTSALIPLEDANTVLTASPLTPTEAEKLLPVAEKVSRLGSSVRKALREQSSPIPDDDE